MAIRGHPGATRPPRLWACTRRDKQGGGQAQERCCLPKGSTRRDAGPTGPTRVTAAPARARRPAGSSTTAAPCSSACSWRCGPCCCWSTGSARAPRWPTAGAARTTRTSRWVPGTGAAPPHAHGPLLNAGSLPGEATAPVRRLGPHDGPEPRHRGGRALLPGEEPRTPRAGRLHSGRDDGEGAPATLPSPPHREPCGAPFVTPSPLEAGSPRLLGPTRLSRLPEGPRRPLWARAPDGTTPGATLGGPGCRRRCVPGGGSGKVSRGRGPGAAFKRGGSIQHGGPPTPALQPEGLPDRTTSLSLPFQDISNPQRSFGC